MASENKIKISKRRPKNKKSTDSKSLLDSLFAEEVKDFIIEQFANPKIQKYPTKVKQNQAVKRAFIRKFKDSKKHYWLMNLKPTQFQWVFDKFIKNEISKSCRTISISGFTKNNSEKIANLGCK